MRNLSIKAKLIGASMLLAIVPLLTISAFSLYKFSNFSTQTTTQAREALVAQSQNLLQSGAEQSRERVETMLRTAQQNIIQFAQSANVQGYMLSLLGRNEVLNEMSLRELQRIVNGLFQAYTAHRDMILEKLSSDLKVAERVLQSTGQMRLDETQQIEWTAVNQVTNAARSVSLPTVYVGEAAIAPNKDIQVESPIVDDVKRLVGSGCTIFQRMNAEGDMLRVATNVQLQDGNRAIGTYIPAVGADGVRNSVIETVLKGDTYAGRAFVVDSWNPPCLYS